MISCLYYRQIVSDHDILPELPANCERSRYPSCVTGKLWAVMISFWCNRQNVSGHESWYPSCVTSILWAVMISFLCNQQIWAVMISFLCNRQIVSGNDIHLVLSANCERSWYLSCITGKLWAIMIPSLAGFRNTTTAPTTPLQRKVTLIDTWQCHVS